MSDKNSMSKPEWLSYRHKLVRQLKRYSVRLDRLEDNKDNLSKYGYRDIGYYEGLTTGIEDIVDGLDELFDINAQDSIEQIPKEDK